MEFSVISASGHKLQVIFVGPSYYFWNSWGGLVAIATRSEENDKEFNIMYGNRHYIGGSLVGSNLLGAVKRFITKAENKYVTAKVTYTETREDLANYDLNIESVKRF